MSTTSPASSAPPTSPSPFPAPPTPPAPPLNSPLDVSTPDHDNLVLAGNQDISPAPASDNHDAHHPGFDHSFVQEFLGVSPSSISVPPTHDLVPQTVTGTPYQSPLRRTHLFPSTSANSQSFSTPPTTTVVADDPPTVLSPADLPPLDPRATVDLAALVSALKGTTTSSPRLNQYSSMREIQAIRSTFGSALATKLTATGTPNDRLNRLLSVRGELLLRSTQGAPWSPLTTININQKPTSILNDLFSLSLDDAAQLVTARVLQCGSTSAFQADLHDPFSEAFASKLLAEVLIASFADDLRSDLLRELNQSKAVLALDGVYYVFIWFIRKLFTNKGVFDIALQAKVQQLKVTNGHYHDFLRDVITCAHLLHDPSILISTFLQEMSRHPVELVRQPFQQYLRDHLEHRPVPTIHQMVASAERFDRLDSSYTAIAPAPSSPPEPDGNLLSFLTTTPTKKKVSFQPSSSSSKWEKHREQPPFLRKAPTRLDEVRTWKNSVGREWEWRWCPRCKIWTTNLGKFHKPASCSQRKARLQQQSNSPASPRPTSNRTSTKHHAMNTIRNLSQQQLVGLIANMMDQAQAYGSTKSSPPSDT